jgi:hypothetical protein
MTFDKVAKFMHNVLLATLFQFFIFLPSSFATPCDSQFIMFQGANKIIGITLTTLDEGLYDNILNIFSHYLAKGFAMIL